IAQRNAESAQRNVQATIDIAQRNAEIAQSNIRVAEEGKITDRFSKAIEQLGSKKLEIRLGGIYALERIANDSERDHWPVMEVLTAYVRENAPSRRKPGQPSEQQPPDKRPSTDIQAILT